MDLGRRRMIFNQYARPNFPGAEQYVYTDDPVVQLDAIQPGGAEQFARTARQRARLRATGLYADADGIFGPSLEWPYREYAVRLVSDPREDADPLGTPMGDGPPQPVTLDWRQGQIGRLRQLDGPPGDAPRLCLFNVLVALEWTPDQYTMRQLEWGFREASDFLYDVTDGRMAFGQVIFGGAELMPCADVQLLASNRLLPRSWVDGLLKDAKYLPVRAGRGVWHARNRLSIGWAEPEAYRALVHEWAHYALGLRDEYVRAAEAGAGATVFVPEGGRESTSIMASLEGTSELVPRAEGGSRNHKSAEWREIVQRYPFLRPSERPLSGPGRLPLPLPRFERVGSLRAAYGERRSKRGRAAELHARRGPFLALPAAGLARPPVVNEQCWVFLLREERGAPVRLVAQGTLDSRAAADGFLLLGAQDGDSVLLVGCDAAGDLAVARSRISVEPDPRDRARTIAVAEGWRDATPPARPLVSVLPRPAAAGADPDQIVVRVQVDLRGGPAPDAVWVLPLAQDRPQPVRVTSPAQDVPVETLDGHVLVAWGDRLAVATFSQGGGPPSHIPASANPTTAGSSDGSVMLFFSPVESGADYSALKVVTTLAHGVDGQGGYAFALASTLALPSGLHPTLVAYHDDPGGLGRYALERRGAGGWEPLTATLEQPGCPYLAVPLDAAGAPGLLHGAAGPLLEHYRLRRA